MPHPRTRAGVVLALLAVACGRDLGPEIPPGPVDLAEPWRVAAPATAGVDAAALDRAAARAAALPRVRSLLVVRSGHLVLERYFGGADEETLFDVRSVTKSVVSTLAGFALDRGALPGLDAPIHELVPAAVADLGPEHEAITVRHLLTMTGGFQWDEIQSDGYNEWILSGDLVGFLLDAPMASAPGSAFVYNSAAVHLLGVILEERTGGSLPTFAQEVLWTPLGIARSAWEAVGDGRVNGGAGLDLRGRDLARVGQLFLQNGWSGDRRVLPEGWVADATTSAFSWSGSFGPLPDLGYGYLWWVDRAHGAYFAWGYGGQFVYVVPERDLVVVATTEWRGASQEPGGSDALEASVLDIIVNEVVPGAALR